MNGVNDDPLDDEEDFDDYSKRSDFRFRRNDLVDVEKWLSRSRRMVFVRAWVVGYGSTTGDVWLLRRADGSEFFASGVIVHFAPIVDLLAELTDK